MRSVPYMMALQAGYFLPDKEIAELPSWAQSIIKRNHEATPGLDLNCNYAGVSAKYDPVDPSKTEKAIFAQAKKELEKLEKRVKAAG